MKNEKELRDLIKRFTANDVMRPQLSEPWIVDGAVYATDGKIAIRLDNAAGLRFEHVQGDRDWRKTAARDLDTWIAESRDAVLGREKFEPVCLPMSFLRKAAYAAMDDARKYAVDHYPETTDDIEEMTVDEAVDRYSVVIMPGTKRHVIAAKYAAIVCDAIDALGPVEFFVPADGFKRGDYGRYRIWCRGERFDILLMAIPSDKMDAHGISVADSVTATLVHSISDDSFVSFALLQFPENEVHDGR